MFAERRKYFCFSLDRKQENGSELPIDHRSKKYPDIYQDFFHFMKNRGIIMKKRIVNKSISLRGDKGRTEDRSKEVESVSRMTKR